MGVGFQYGLRRSLGTVFHVEKKTRSSVQFIFCLANIFGLLSLSEVMLGFSQLLVGPRGSRGERQGLNRLFHNFSCKYRCHPQKNQVMESVNGGA